MYSQTNFATKLEKLSYRIEILSRVKPDLIPEIEQSIKDKFGIGVPRATIGLDSVMGIGEEGGIDILMNAIRDKSIKDTFALIQGKYAEWMENSMNIAEEIMHRAEMLGYHFSVVSEGQCLCDHANAKEAWEHVESVEDASINFIKSGEDTAWARVVDRELSDLLCDSVVEAIWDDLYYEGIEHFDTVTTR